MGKAEGKCDDSSRRSELPPLLSKLDSGASSEGYLGGKIVTFPLRPRRIASESTTGTRSRNLRIVVIGPGGVGKSCLVRMIYNCLLPFLSTEREREPKSLVNLFIILSNYLHNGVRRYFSSLQTGLSRSMTLL